MHDKFDNNNKITCLTIWICGSKVTWPFWQYSSDSKIAIF